MGIGIRGDQAFEHANADRRQSNPLAGSEVDAPSKGMGSRSPLVSRGFGTRRLR